MNLYRKIALRYLLSNEEPVEEPSKGKPSVNIGIANKVREKLKDNKYKSKSSGNEISFNTAYSQKHPQAIADFKKEFQDALEDAQKEDQPQKMTDEESQKIMDEILDKINPPQPQPEPKTEEEQLDDFLDLDYDLDDGEREEIGDLIEDPKKVYEEGSSNKKVVEKLVKNIEFDNPPYDSSKPIEEQRSENIQKSYARYDSLKQEDRKEVKKSFKEKLKDQSLSSEQRSALMDSYGSLVASQIVNGDKDAPPSDPLFTKVLRESKSEGLKNKAIQLVSEMAISETNSSSRSVKKEFFNSLNDDDFLEAIGGSDSPYGKLAEKLNPNFCPSTPENGDMGGKVVGADECPMPLSDEMRKNVRKHITSMMMDGMVFRETDEKGKEKEQPKEEKSKLDEWLGGDGGKDYLQELIDGNDASGHVVQMRSLNAQSQFNSSSPHAQRIRDNMVNMATEGGSLDDMDSLFDFEEEDRPKRDDYETDEDFRVALSYYQMSKMGHIRRGSLNVVSKYLDNLFITPSNTYGGNKMISKNSTVYVDYQQRAKGFEVGMRVFPFFEGNPNKSGIVRAVYPAIGMVDVQFPHGSSRLPVEDLVVDTSGDVNNVKMDVDSVPGGLGSYPVSTGAKRVASMHMKKAIYWKERDRKYKMKRNEGHPHCPKCKEVKLRNTSYKRRNGLSEHLLGCPSCLFLIKSTDII